MKEPFSVGRGCAQSKKSISTLEAPFGGKSVYYICRKGQETYRDNRTSKEWVCFQASLSSEYILYSRYL